MNLEEEKKELITVLDEIQTEAKILLQRIKKAKIELLKVESLEEAELYSQNNDLEEGFEHIVIF